MNMRVPPALAPTLVRAHVEMLHSLAAASGVEGILVLCGYGQNPVTRRASSLG